MIYTGDTPQNICGNRDGSVRPILTMLGSTNSCIMTTYEYKSGNPRTEDEDVINPRAGPYQ